MEKVKAVARWVLAAVFLLSGVGWLVPAGGFAPISGALGILAALATAPFPALDEFFEQRRIKGALRVVLVFVLVLVAGGLTPKDESAELPERGAAQTQEEEAAPALELSEASLSELVTKLDGVKPENVAVSLSGGVCEVSYTDVETHWNEGSMIGAEMSAFINFCRDAFALDGLDEVKWLVSVELTDSRGNASVDEAVKIDMLRDAFSLYDWDNLDGKRIYEQFSADCLTFWVRSSIANKASANDIYYSAH